MILGILFYLMQAHEFLQEGMTYKLGCSFYLAWIGVFLFLITGLRWGGVGFGVWACVRGCRWGQGGWDRVWDGKGTVDWEDWVE